MSSEVAGEEALKGMGWQALIEAQGELSQESGQDHLT